MFTHKGITYILRNCQGKHEVQIDALKFFKTYDFGDNNGKNSDKNFQKAHDKAKEIINEATKNEL